MFMGAPLAFVSSSSHLVVVDIRKGATEERITLARYALLENPITKKTKLKETRSKGGKAICETKQQIDG
jgi:hypothetical protein